MRGPLGNVLPAELEANCVEQHGGQVHDHRIPTDWPQRNGERFKGMPDHDTQLIADIYSGLLDIDAWPALMHRFAPLFGAQSASLFSTHSPVDPDALLQLHNIDPQMGLDFRAGWFQEDIYAHAALRHGLTKAGSVVLGSEVVPREVALKSRYYNEFTRHFDVDSLLGSVLFDGTEDDGLPFTNLCWHRAPGQPDFGLEEKARLTALLPHFQQALRLQHRLRTLMARQELAAHIDEMRGTAGLLLDARMRVVDANATGQALLAAPRSGLLRFAGDRLRSLGSRCAPTLDEAMRRCRAGIPVKLLIEITGQTLSLTTGTLVALPCDQQTLVGSFERERFLLMINMPQDDTGAVVAQAAQLFGYTQAEQRVVQGLLNGQTLEEIAQSNGTSFNTVRTQTRSVLAKTGVIRQVDLVRLLSRLV